MTFTTADALTLGTIFEGVFYGVYVVLFILYLVLRRRNHCVLDGPLTLAQILLFGLCTIAFGLDIPTDYFGVVPDVANDAAPKLDMSFIVVFTLIDYLAQMILLYRCWIIWNRRWAVVAVPGFLAFVTLGGGFALVALYHSPLWSTEPERIARLYYSIGPIVDSISLGVNALTTSLIVTRIFLISREIHPDLDSNSHRSPRMINAMLIESGLLMFAFQLALVVLLSTRSATDMIFGPIAQINGITPTLLYIRIAMGTAYDKTTEGASSLRFAHSGTQATGPRISTAGIQSQVIDIDPDQISDNKSAADTTV